MQTGTKRRSQGRVEVQWRRNPKRLPVVPRVRAKVLVALAATAPQPLARRTGKVRTVPPPATALMAPAARAEPKRARTSQGVMRGAAEGFGRSWEQPENDKLALGRGERRGAKPGGARYFLVATGAVRPGKSSRQRGQVWPWQPRAVQYSRP